MDTTELKYLAAHTGSAFAPALGKLHVYTTEAGTRRAQVQNGRYTVDVPTDLPELTADADRLLAAWEACRTDPRVSVAEHNVTVTAGRIRARIALFDPQAYPRTTPDPETAHTAPGVAALLSRLQPFVATDASRAWATAVCLANGHAYATNNVVLVREPFEATFPHPVNLPVNVFDAIIAKGEPVGIGASESSVTFYFEGGAWIRTLLVSGDWPTGVVDGLVAATPADGWVTVNPELRRAVDTATKLGDSRHPVAEFRGGGLALLDDSFEAEDLMPVPEAGRINTRMTSLVLSQAQEVQWHTPRQDVHAFRAGALQGVFGGQR